MQDLDSHDKDFETFLQKCSKKKIKLFYFIGNLHHFLYQKRQMFITYKIRTQHQYRRIMKLTSVAYHYYQSSKNPNSSVWLPKDTTFLEVNLEDSCKYSLLNVLKLSVYLKEITFFIAMNLTEVLSLMQPLWIEGS